MQSASEVILLNNSSANDLPNLISVKFDQLSDDLSAPFSAEPCKCGNLDCQAVLTNVSKLSQQNSERLWTCEFCGHENIIAINDDEIPSDNTLFLTRRSLSRPTSAKDTPNLVFCIDISGSMAITKQAKTNIRLPADEFRRNYNAQLMQDVQGADFQQINCGERHISRIEFVQKAIIESLEHLEKNNPGKRVALITFNDKIIVIGDGSSSIRCIENASLDNEDKIMTIFTEEPLRVETIEKNNGKLKEKICTLQETGGTALGPALYYSVLQASRKPCSQVLLCTDGEANMGLGSLDRDDCIESSKQFYRKIIDKANLSGVSVSIVTLEDTNCKLGILGEVANQTKGSIKVVNLFSLSEEFSSIVKDETIASKVKTSIILPRQFYVHDYENNDKKESVVNNSIGNVKKSIEISFDFKDRPEEAAISPYDENKSLKKIPIQLQIEFTAQDGSEYLKVITMQRPITNDKDLFLSDYDPSIAASHVLRVGSELVKKGKKSEEIESLAVNLSEKLVIKNEKSECFNREAFKKSLEALKILQNKSKSEYIPRSKNKQPRRPSLSEAHLAGISERPSRESSMQNLDDVSVSQQNQLANVNSQSLSEYKKRSNPTKK